VNAGAPAPMIAAATDSDQANGRAREEKALREWFQPRVGVPVIFRTANPTTAPRVTPALLAVRKFLARGGVSGGRLLVLLGPTGVGKTFGACAMINEVLLTLRGAQRFIVAPTLYRRLDDFATRGAAMDEAASVTLLVLDDVPVQRHQRVAGLVEELLCTREAYRLATVLTSNATPQQLQALLGDRLIDRFRAWGEIHALTGPSLRQPSEAPA